MLKDYVWGGFVLRRLSLKGECGICVVFLVERGYEKNFIQQKWIERDKHPEMEHWGTNQKKENSRIRFTVTYHPGLPDIEGMLRKLHPVLHSPQRCRNAIKDVPMVAFLQIYISIKKTAFLWYYFLHNIFIFLDLQKHGYRNLLYTLWLSLVVEHVFFFLFIVTFYLFNRYRIGHSR